MEEKDFQTQANEHGRFTVEWMREDLYALRHAGDCRDDDCERDHDEDAAREAIEQRPLSAQLRSGWYSPGETPEPEEYEVLLGTGGPASRIIGRLGRYSTPESAHYEYQDWFKPWTRANLTSEEEEVILNWVSNLYFGS